MKLSPIVALNNFPSLHFKTGSPISSNQILGFTEDDWQSVGLSGQQIYVNESIIADLLTAQGVAEASGYSLTVIDGHHPEALYDRLSQRVCSSRMSQHARYLMKSRVHSTGLAVNVLLWDKRKKAPVELFLEEDGERALFQGFYQLSVEGRDSVRVFDRERHRREDEFRLQQILVNAMRRGGFTTKPLRRVCHFVHRSVSDLPTPRL